MLLDKRREALLECLESLKGVYSKPWARTSVDIAVQVPLQEAPPGAAHLLVCRPNSSCFWFVQLRMQSHIPRRSNVVCALS